MAALALGVFKIGWYFRALEGLVGGEGWEGCIEESPADVLTLTGFLETLGFGGCYWVWTAVLASKRKVSQGAFNQVVVQGADHVWTSSLVQLCQEVDKWLAEYVRR